ncbi:serine protease, partial [bacterium]
MGPPFPRTPDHRPKKSNMRMIESRFLSLVALWGVGVAMAAGQGQTLTPKETFERCRDSIVSIEAEYEDGKSTGTGFFFQNSKTVATCLHVVQGAKRITIKARDGDSWSPISVSFDEDGDTALLRLGATSGRKPIEAAAPASVSVGDPIVVIGDPLGLTGSLSTGVVGALRQDKGVPLVQITAPVSEGSSGSPVIDAYGKAIGIVSFFFSEGQNVNMAVSTKLAGTVADGKALTMSQFDAYAFKPAEGGAKNESAAPATGEKELTKAEARSEMSRRFAMGYNDFFIARMRWNIVWYEDADATPEFLALLRKAQEAFASNVIRGDDWRELQALAKVADIPQKDLDEFRALQQTVARTSTSYLESQVKWTRAGSSNASIEAADAAVSREYRRLSEAMTKLIDSAEQ